MKSLKDVNNNRIIIILGFLTMLGPMTTDLYLPALPAMGQIFNESIKWIQFSLSIYPIGFACGQLIFGPLSDRFGRMPILKIGLCTYILTSLSVALSHTITMLITTRFLQAFTTAAVAVNITAIVKDLFNRQESARIYSFIMMIMIFAPIFAPIIGGQMIVFFSWYWIFVLLAIIGVLGLIVVYSFLSETHPQAKRSPISLKHIIHNYKLVLNHQKALYYILAQSFFFSGILAFITGSPYIYITLYHIPENHYGYYLALNTISLALVSFINVRLIKKINLKNIAFYGTIIATVAATILLINTVTGFGGIVGIIIPIMIFIACLGLTSPNLNALILSYFPDIAGTATAVLNSLRFIISGIASFAVGILHPLKANSMSLVIFVGSIIALFFLVKSKKIADNNCETN